MDSKLLTGSLPMSSTSTSPAMPQSSTNVASYSEPSSDFATSALSSSGSGSGSGQVSSASDHVFVVHSQDSLENRRPPDIDNKALARQKRKRTSPEDQAALEFAYNCNPKPDRATRMRIVEQVALGEKEVQIWFQNRRQNTRRKSRPAEMNVTSAPCSLEACANGSDHRATNITTTAALDTGNCGHRVQNNMQNLLNIQSGGRPQHKRSSSCDGTKILHKPSLVSSASETATKPQRPVSAFKRTASGTPLSLGLAGLQSEHSKSPVTLQELISSTSSSAGYFANRRNTLHVNQLNRLDESSQSQADTDYQPSTSSQTSNKSSSLVRLSMTSNGRAKVVTEADISPPKKTPVPIDTDPFSSELRSYDKKRSILTGVCASFGPNGEGSRTIVNGISNSARGVPKLRNGRSRDSRAWEFWCDADARNALSQKADKEWSGSAADAIGLMRSSSKAELRRRASGGGNAGGSNDFGKRNRHALAEVSNKRQKSVLVTNSGEGNGKRKKMISKERRLLKLKRYASAYGRMQGRDGTEVVGEDLNCRKGLGLAVKDILLSGDGIEAREKKTGEEDGDDFEIAQTESDKENWDPEGTSHSHISKRRDGITNRAGMQSSEKVIANENADADLKSEQGEMSNTSSNGLLQDNQRRLKTRIDRSHRRQNMSLKPCDGSVAGGQEDPEVARFMGGSGSGSGCENVSHRSWEGGSAKITRCSTAEKATAVEEADMHCVESLLSLSKGTWVSSV